MKRGIFAPLLVTTAAALLAAAGGARAQDESMDTRIEIRAPLEAAECDRTPQTIRVLGLPIDVTGARSSDEEAPGPDEDAPSACESLVVGRPVTVRLGGDRAPLSAAEIVPGDDEQDIAIRAPIQAVSSDLQTITLLGLPIDASTLRFATSDGEDIHLNDPDLDPAARLIGRFFQADLDPGSLPSLVAAGVEVMIFPGEGEAGVEDGEGVAIEDEEGQLLPSQNVTVFEFREVFLPAFIDTAPKQFPRSHAPHVRGPGLGRMSPQPIPPRAVGAPAIRMRAAPGFVRRGPSASSFHGAPAR